MSLSKKIIDILNNTYSTELKFFKDKYKFKINLVQNAEFLSQEFLFSFYDVKKKLISEFNGTEVKEDTSVKEKPCKANKHHTQNEVVLYNPINPVNPDSEPDESG